MDMKCVFSKTQCLFFGVICVDKSFSDCLRFLETQVM
jgi:hypothetical protein